MRKTIIRFLNTAMLMGVVSLSSQVQRIELYEEFTGEACGPCGALNPYITHLINSNQSPNRKIVLLRYQTNIPSDPGNGSLYRDNKKDVDDRMSYYGVQMAPYARFDGRELADTLVPLPAGWAGFISQEVIDTSYKLNSPFAITANHQFIQKDSMAVHIKITAAANYTPSGKLKLHLSMIEKEIHFPVKLNGCFEKDFEWVMRKMFPDASGTNLDSLNWVNGQSKDIYFKIKVPDYIKDKTQIAFITFLQEDGSKKVLNTVFSDAVVIPETDMSLVKVSVPDLQCVNSVTPGVIIKNTGTPVINSGTIYYYLDGATLPQIQTFNATINSGQSYTVNLPQLTNLSGEHKLKVTIGNPNGITDTNTPQDTKETTFALFSNTTMTPLKEDFTNFLTTTLLPNGYSTRTLTFSHPSSGHLAAINYADFSPSGSPACVANFLIYPLFFQQFREDELYLPKVGLKSNAKLSFYFAHAGVNSPAGSPPFPADEKLEVMVSTDCGITWSTVLALIGDSLRTVPLTNSNPASFQFYKPASASEWKKASCDLAAYNNKEVLIKFRTNSGTQSDNLYIDDINIDGVIGINENSVFANMSVYPNPCNANLSVSLNAKNYDKALIRIYNELGEQVYEENNKPINQGSNIINVNTEGLANGFYKLIINASGEEIKQSFVISKN